jgi:CSLREA domain-containing protein
VNSPMAALVAALVAGIPLVVAHQASASPHPAPAAAPAAPPTYVVNSLADGADSRPGDGICRTAAGRCTLRAAVQESNGSLSRDLITLPAGRFDLSIASAWPFPSQTLDLESDAGRGDLDIFGTLGIRGRGAGRTIVDAHGLDRVFNVEPAARFTLEGVTVTGGDATRNNKTPMDISDGGGILNAGTLTLDGVAVVGNRADGGGGVFSIPFTRVTVRDSLIARNQAVEGGGLRVDGSATIANSTITDNHLFARVFPFPVPDEMTGYGGGIDHRGTGNVWISDSTITRNSALKAGGGYNSGQNYAPIPVLTGLWPYRTFLFNSVVRGNTAAGRPSDCHVSSMVIQSRGHNADGDGSCFLSEASDAPKSAEPRAAR